MTARTLAAGAATVFGVAFLSAGLAYFIAGCLLAWWLLVDLGRAEDGGTHALVKCDQCRGNYTDEELT